MPLSHSRRYVLVRDGARTDERPLEANGECLVGRAAEASIRLEAPDVSRIHARLETRAGDVLLRCETGQAGRTCLVARGGARLAEPQPVAGWISLVPGDVVRLGSSATLEFRQGWSEVDDMEAAATDHVDSLAGRTATFAGGDRATQLGLALATSVVGLVGTRAHDEEVAAALASLRDTLPGTARVDVFRVADSEVVARFSSEGAHDRSVAEVVRAHAEALIGGPLSAQWFDGDGGQPGVLAVRVGESAFLVVSLKADAPMLTFPAVAAAKAFASLVSHVLDQRESATSDPAPILGRGVAGSSLDAYAGLVASPAMRELLDDVARAARDSRPILLTGETGVGKGLIAEYVHRTSGRSGKCVAVNCAQLTPGMAASELFGHVKGSFTGATSDHAGVFVVSESGTVFLDEIGDLAADLQPLMLKVIEEGTLKPVGASLPVSVDVRVVAATHRHSQGANAIRPDLLERLSAHVFHVPPLRERAAEIIPLAERFLAEVSPDKGFDGATLDWLMRYSWPRNVRELKHRVQRAATLARGRFLRPEHLVRPDDAPEDGARDELSLNWELASHAFERAYLERLLAAAGGNRGKAASLMGVDRTTLQRRLKVHGLGASRATVEREEK